jgi:plastocyanin
MRVAHMAVHGGGIGSTRRLAAMGLVLALTAVGCAQAKDTGLPAGPSTGGNAGTQVAVQDSVFSPKTLTIKAGQTVTWNWIGVAPHNVESDTGLFNSHPGCTTSSMDKCSKKGDTPFTHTFTAAGTYPYFCVIHGAKGGIGMAGTIVVTG